MNNRAFIDIVTDLLCGLVSSRPDKRREVMAKWFLLSNNPWKDALRHFPNSRQSLDQVEQGILAYGWRAFERGLPSVAANLAGFRPNWNQPTKDQDGVGLDRLLNNLRAYVATAFAAHWARQESSTAGADTELFTWLARAAGLKESPLAQLTGWTTGMAPADRTALAASSLTSVSSPAEILRAYLWTGWWLGTAKPERSRRIPIVTVRSLPGSETPSPSPAHLHHIDLQLFALPKPLEGLIAGTAVEHPLQWNQPLGVEFVGTAEEAYLETWRDQERKPLFLWQLHIHDGLQGEPFTGASHGLALHVGCRVIRANKEYDQDIIFSARVVQGQLATVGGLLEKRQAAFRDSNQELGRFGYWKEDDHQFQADNHQLPARCPVADVEAAVRLATRTQTEMAAYFQAVCKKADELDFRPGKPAFSNLYVEPDGLEQKLHESLKPEKMDGSEDSKDKPAGEALLREHLDAGELPYGDRNPARRRPWAEVRAKLGPGGRCVVVGPPGQGKTTLARMTAHSLAKEADGRMKAGEWSLENAPLPLVVSLPDLVQQVANGEGAAYFAQCLLSLVRERFSLSREQIAYLENQLFDAEKQRLTGNRVWLFLDGLDEVAKDSPPLSKLWPVLDSFQGRVILGTRPYGVDAHADALRRHWPEALSCRLAPFTPEQSKEFALKWFGEGKNFLTIKGLLERSHSVGILAHNPYLMTLLCVVSLSRTIPDDVTRGELYDWFLEALLGERARKWNNFLDEMAARMIWRNVGAPSVMGPQELEEWLEKSGQTRPPKKWGQPDYFSLQDHVQALAEELCDTKRRLLVPDLLVPAGDNRSLVFPHRSIAEFLAGRYLAEAVNRWGWDYPMPLLEGCSAEKVVQKKSWLPDWEEVIVFMAGFLEKPEELLKKLEDEKSDDIFRHRLALAARCLSEIKPEKRSNKMVFRLSTTITTRVMEMVWNLDQEEILSLEENKNLLSPNPFGLLRAVLPGEHLRAVLPGLASVDGHLDWNQMTGWARVVMPLETWDSLPILDALRDLFCRGNIIQLRAAGWALRWIGSAVVHHPKLLDAVADLLRDGTKVQKETAAWTVGRIGVAGAQNPGLLNNLAALLRDGTNQQRELAGKAVGAIGAAIGKHPGILDALGSLADLLRNGTIFQTWGTIRDIEEVGEVAGQHPGIVDALATLLRDGTLDQKAFAARAVGKIGRAAAKHPGILNAIDSLGDQLQEGTNQQKWIALIEVNAIGRAAGRFPRILKTLNQLLRDGIEFLKDEAIRAVWSIGEACGQNPGILDALADLLREGKDDQKVLACRAIGAIKGSAGHHLGILNGLANLFRNGNNDQKDSAGWAVRDIGGATREHPGIIDAFFSIARLLRDGTEDQKVGAARAVEAMGWSGDMPPGILDTLSSLASLLRDGTADQKKAAARAVAGLGPAAQHPGFLDALTSLLRAGMPDQKEAAARAVGDRSAAVQQPGLLEALASLLRDGTHFQKKSAALTLGIWMERDGYRFFGLWNRHPWVCRTIGDLSS